MQKRTDYPPRWCASLPESLKSHLGRLARQQNGHTLNSEINAIHQHVDASHKQTSADLEKVRQFISEVLQNEVQRNMALRVLIQHLEERASEGTRSLSEQVESNRQLKLQVHELQKHLEDKDHSLAQANQTVAFLKHQLKDLYQQLQSHQNNHRTIQEVTEWLQDDEANPNVVESETGCSSGQSETPVPGGSSLIGRLSGGSPVIGEMQLLPMTLSGIKEEEADAGYEHSQTDGDGAPTDRQQAVPLPVNIKLENMEDEGVCEEGSTKSQTQSCRVGSPGEPPGHEHTETPSGGGGSVGSSGGSGGSVWRRHLCPTCGRGFPYWSTLQLHMASHTQAIPQGLDRPLIVCARCGKTFSHRRLLEQHELTRCHGHAHAPERPYRCAQCGKTFALPKHLKQHQRIHSGEKPYSCHYCPKSFTFLGNLRVHERTHTGERPYACAACGKRFSFVGNLRTHERIHRRRDAEEAGPGMGAGTGAGAGLGLEWSEVVVQDGVI